MSKIEQNILSWINKHLLFILLAACTLVGIIVRLGLKNIASGDFTYCLQPWYEKISETGLSKQVGNYNLLYQMIIWVMTKLPIRPLYSYKVFSCVFDMVMAVTAFAIVDMLYERQRREKSVLAYCAVWLSPIVFLNSAAWAQCDAVYSAFCLFAVMMMERKKYSTGLCLLGIGFAFKLQAVFILPLFFFVYYRRRDFSILQFILVPLSMIGISLPAVLIGGRNLAEVISIYADQTIRYKNISMNYPSVWLLLCKANDSSQYGYMRKPTVLFTVFALLLIMFWWLQKGYKAQGMNIYIMAYLLCYTCVLFLPSMHERYGFLYEVLAIILAVMIPKMIPLAIALICVSMNTYGAYLFGINVNLSTLAWLNLGIYIASIYILGKELVANPNEAEHDIFESLTGPTDRSAL